MNAPSRWFFCLFATALFCLTNSGNAAIVLNTNPLDGVSNPNDGIRTVINGTNGAEIFATSAELPFLLNTNVFNITPGFTFLNDFASNLGTGADIIVLRDIDNDNNTATPFNAIAAANLIANSITQDRAGFYIYSNSVLNVNRLVYSTNLRSTTSDLAILARITDQTGNAAINALGQFTQANFQAVPEPTSLGLVVVGSLTAVFFRRRRPLDPEVGN